MTDKIILPESPEAATYRTGLCGWVSRQGVFYGEDEKSARYLGSTHHECIECGASTPKGYVRCDSCMKKLMIVRHAARPHETWDGKTPLYSHIADVYLYDREDVTNAMGANQCTAEELQLVICRPVYLRPRPIDGDEWADELPEDGELPKAVGDAVDALNKAISEAEPVSWMPGPIAVDVAQLEDEK